MANSAEIIRLMRHAADRLAEEDVYQVIEPFSKVERKDLARSTAAALIYAEAILRTVAAVLDETDAEPRADADRQAPEETP